MVVKVHTNKKAFTLVELLVVISIIALLLAILMPSLQKARQQATALVCMVNTRSLGTATVLYASDNNDRYPQNYNYISGYNTMAGPFWDDRLFPYVDKNFDVFLCPVVAQSSDGRRAIAWLKARPSYGKGGHCKSYRINSILTGLDPNKPLDHRSYSTSAVRNPANVILFVDANPQPFSYAYSNGLRAFTDLWPLHYPKFISGTTWTDSWGNRARRGGSGFTFADGHSESISWKYSEDTWGDPPRLGLKIRPGK